MATASNWASHYISETDLRRDPLGEPLLAGIATTTDGSGFGYPRGVLLGVGGPLRLNCWRFL